MIARCGNGILLGLKGLSSRAKRGIWVLAFLERNGGGTQKPRSLASRGMTSFANTQGVISSRYLRRESECLRLAPLSGQVIPLRVLRIDQRYALGAGPRLDLLLTSNRIADIFEDLEIDEASDVVLRREVGDFFSLMLFDAPANIVGCSRVKGP